MSSRKDGGPAFFSNATTPHPLRAWFAGRVLPEVYKAAIANGVDSAEAVAEEAVDLADALIAALERKA